MQIKSRIAFIFAVAILFQPTVLLAADTDTAKTTDTVQKTVTGVGVPSVAEGNRLEPRSVTVGPVRQCRDFDLGGPAVILPAHRADHYECPPGYKCKGVVGGFQCQSLNLTSLPADSPECSYETCYR